MKKFLIAGALGATAMGGLAYAAQPASAPNGARVMSDGVLTREEAQSQADKRFDRLDFNRDGKVSEETMMAARGDGLGQGMRAGGKRGHGMRRGGSDGAGRRDENRRERDTLGATGGRPDSVARRAQMQTRAHERFVRLDSNRDGQLDRGEFRAQAVAHFASLDANSDGSVDAAERFAAREKMRERRQQMRGATAPAPKPSA